MRSVFWVVLASILLFSGCKTLEPEPRPPLPIIIPDHFSMDQGGTETMESWWQIFGSDELNALIQDALNNNFDLTTLAAKTAQAEALVKKENAAFFPDLGFSAGGQKRGTQVKQGGKRAVFDDTHSWQGTLSGSYTADVWGETAAGKQARMASLKAAELAFRTAALEVTAGIAETWVDIISVRNKNRILDHQIQINQTLLKLQRLRFVNGKANALDVSQQREALAEASSQVPLLEKQERLLLNHLAFLSGKTQVDPLQVTTPLLPEPVPLPRVGIPSELLKNRPDIQAARMRLSSALWEVTAARADLLPTFNLTAQALFSSGTLDLLFQNWVATLAASIAGPLVDGGLRRAELDRVQAVVDETVSVYARTIAQAIFEVEDLLVTLQKQATYIRLLEEELEVVRLTLKDARVQYQNGKSSYLAYLIAWTSIERLERQLVGERATLVKEQIKLYRSLGWTMVPELKYIRDVR
ncbi:efflux transporter outer membrane subunit [Desulfobacula sp.]|uniref:efflux transporter outer membrane subunit n=1 Tax=Desulfobacula sp. TaxID=2593537 RepID=UPI0026221A38|nr:efflux transporter outer membrane subunit [Desulfobacula sp.]